MDDMTESARDEALKLLREAGFEQLADEDDGDPMCSDPTEAWIGNTYRAVRLIALARQRPGNNAGQIKDSARLDWLDEQWAASQKEGEAIKFIVDPTAGLDLGVCDIRAAIDAAMASDHDQGVA
jgi:hypothetical protein